MGYKINTEAYEILIQIEVGIREFLIDIIKKNGVYDWFNSFFGSLQRDSLNEIVVRILDAKKENISPDVKDQYIFKLNRTLKELSKTYDQGNLKHPFYYLNWNDMENLMMMKTNVAIIENEIGSANRRFITDGLRSISLLRNDIAHSRFIRTQELELIRAVLIQITALIPNFKTYANNQTTEQGLGALLAGLKEKIVLLGGDTLIDSDNSAELIIIIDDCLSSFWLLSLNKNLYDLILTLKSKYKNYEVYQKTPGGLLELIKWKSKNKQLFTNIINLINGKI